MKGPERSFDLTILCSICACMSLITILALPNTFVYICFFFLIGRRMFISRYSLGALLIYTIVYAVYSNSLMATLNARKGIREASSKGHDTSLSLHNMHPTSHGNPTNFGVSHLDSTDPWTAFPLTCSNPETD